MRKGCVRHCGWQSSRVGDGLSASRKGLKVGMAPLVVTKAVRFCCACSIEGMRAAYACVAMAHKDAA